MPALQSATQEAFAQAIARKVKGVDAYSEGHLAATEDHRAFAEIRQGTEDALTQIEKELKP